MPNILVLSYSFWPSQGHFELRNRLFTSVFTTHAVALITRTHIHLSWLSLPFYRGPYVGKQIPQHSMQISRQSDDSQHASMMPQSMSHGQLQSSPRSSAQQQQQQASDVQVPHEAWATTILHRVRNSQNRQARMQWTQQSALRVLQRVEQNKTNI